MFLLAALYFFQRSIFSTRSRFLTALLKLQFVQNFTVRAKTKLMQQLQHANKNVMHATAALSTTQIYSCLARMPQMNIG
jgi:hypothetical protein